ncbi:hypothetical protein Daus18300_008427 [Diaporthe australafricana]|uniref:Ubiquitin-like protease family profile domain-containing protein n=1 Tax=Diaporthe australafricana TaxID=127596 RepID=A0ABR3WII3_9PEZI
MANALPEDISSIPNSAIKDSINVFQHPTPELASPDVPDISEPMPKKPGLSSLQTADCPQLEEEFIDTMMQHIVAYRPHLTTVPSETWYPHGSDRKIQPCYPATTFILPVKLNAERWVCVVIRVGKREALYFDPIDGQADGKTEPICKQLASTFVSKCLSDSFSDWNEGWRVIPSDHSPRRSNADDSGIYCLDFAICIALGLEELVFSDSRYLRIFYCVVYENINHLASASAKISPASRDRYNLRDVIPAKDKQQHSARSIATLQLKDALPSQYVSIHLNQLPEVSIEMDQDRIGAKSIAELAASQQYFQECIEKCSRRRQEDINAFVDAQLSALRPPQATVKHLVTVTKALRDSDKQVLGVTSTCNQAKAAIRIIRQQKEAVGAMKAELGLENEIASIAEQDLALFDSIHKREEERLKLLERLRLAMGQAQAQVTAAADDLKKTEDTALEYHTAHIHCHLAL